MKKHSDDMELANEIKHLAANLESIAAEQSAERQARLNDPVRVEQLELAKERLAISELLYNARKDANLTQAELARRLNRTQPYIAKLERGRGNISYDTICRYAAACGKRLVIKMA